MDVVQYYVHSLSPSFLPLLPLLPLLLPLLLFIPLPIPSLSLSLSPGENLRHGMVFPQHMQSHWRQQ